MEDLIIHVHGFLSANNAERVVVLKDYVEKEEKSIEVISPRLSNTPRIAVEQLHEIIKKEKLRRRRVGLVGYSLGGYFATYLASQYDLPAVLINPVVRGYDIMCEFFGECYNEHTGEHFDIGEADIDFLIGLHLEPLPNPERFMVLLQKGDEIVDPAEALAYYEDSALIVEEGGCHEFEHFENHVAKVIDFLF